MTCLDIMSWPPKIFSKKILGQRSWIVYDLKHRNSVFFFKQCYIFIFNYEKCDKRLSECETLRVNASLYISI